MIKKRKRIPDEFLEKYVSGVDCSSREGSLKKTKETARRRNIAFCNAL